VDLPVHVDPDGAEPLYRQVYAQIRGAILAGRLPPGSRLPPTRHLATALGLSRNTVNEAYAALLAEGYLEARVGAGTYVAALLPDELLTPHPATATLKAPVPPPSPRQLSAWAGRIGAAVGPTFTPRRAVPLPYDFRPGLPAWDAFPATVWRLLVSEVWEEIGPETLIYGDPAGYGPLRDEIAAYLGRTRAVRCRPVQIVVVSGSQQALDLLARLTLDPGDAVAVEDPCYLGAQRVFSVAGARLVPVPVDRAGLVVEALPAQGARLLYVTPSHQYPTGAILSLPRRLRLLEWAARTGTLVVEDDYDSQYRYTGRPLESLQGLDRAGTVVYTGSFSTALFPALRIGYAVLPPDLVDLYRAAKAAADREAASPQGRALALFMARGHFERHLRRMQALYAARRAALLTALARDLPEAVPGPAESGMHVMVHFPAPLDDTRLVAAAARAGVGLYSARPYYLHPPAQAAFLLGFASLPEATIAEGIRRLRAVLAAEGVITAG
jgi:GntR family transcriptional regulator/MocR family aminotransferase